MYIRNCVILFTSVKAKISMLTVLNLSYISFDSKPVFENLLWSTIPLNYDIIWNRRITVNENSIYVHKWFCNVWIVLHAFGTVKCKNHKSCCVSKFKSCSFNLLIVTERLQIPNSGWTIGQRAHSNKFQSFKRLIIWKSTLYERCLT